ncbi:Dps family protein [Fulvivirga sedimenti]|uniref:DNA starvation/stationary phase protection protein n=1 Tax=Fulvivirga sedimenti TaxID=2879465 RepID=A0A9X1HVJ8_9BACT|nr:DNA starvation/stationary phase protection protein [Fulvivirga sedimenti]MCA6078735.1 DNA starvation/stationary phase protection protein [Fulvivirga sedimenti]
METDILEKINDTNTKKTRSWAYKKLGYSKEETKEIVDALNQLLANYHVHYQKLRNYHWNVTGADFFDIHEKFEAQYEQAKLNIDEIAERIRVFGYRPLSTLTEYLEVSAIKETPTNKKMSGMEMVREILNDFEILLSYMVDAADAAIDVGDVGTEEMIKDFVKNLEKTHWMFTAFASDDE